MYFEIEMVNAEILNIKSIFKILHHIHLNQSSLIIQLTNIVRRKGRRTLIQKSD